MEDATQITTASAADMILAKQLTEFRGVECVAHTVHLLEYDATNGSPIKAIVDGMKKIVTFFKQSTTAKDKCVPPRWDSDYLMIERFLELSEDFGKEVHTQRFQANVEIEAVGGCF